MKSVPEFYGELVFNYHEMSKRLSPQVYEHFRQAISGDYKVLLDLELANKMASAMQEWALEKGATHYTHWFHPMTGLTAEKHESFIHTRNDGTVIMKFTGKELVKGETDGSSFPSGGLRSTFEARGYTAWDASAFAFIRNGTLYIPTVFLAYNGEVLDRKTPLHRSSSVVKEQTKRLLDLLGYPTQHVRVTVGAEQEYFLIPKEVFQQRLDLKLTGRTLFGARSPKTHELEDHYYGNIKPKIINFMSQLDKELWRLGIPAKTRHNEVAPCQHEIAPIFERVSVAADHNKLMMEIMRSVADQHGLVCLLHEKPFAFMNGSGKHNNWSITADSVGNLLEPGNDPANNVSFLLYVVCIMAAVDTHQDLLRIAVASAGNDHRLGGNEAPPAIISIFLGEEINDILQTMVNKTTRKTLPQNNTHHGMKYVASFAKDHADRNRTSPFAFTGNKFEFRMPGSATDIAICNTVLNTALADILEGVCDRLAQAKNRVEAVKNIIKELFKKHQHILFDGDGYSVAWQKEAKRRHLLNLKTTPEALAHYPTEKNITLLTKHGIYTKREILARYNVMVNEYCKTIKIESLTMLDMFNRQILPSVLKYQNQLAKLISNKKSVNHSVELTILKKITALTVSAVKTKDTLINDLARVQTYRDILQKATNYHRLVLASMGELRDYCDQLERLMPKVLWPIPTYADILFSL